MAIFLMATMLLPSCSAGIKDPVGDSEIGKTELWAPLLSQEEADAPLLDLIVMFFSIYSISQKIRFYNIFFMNLY